MRMGHAEILLDATFAPELASPGIDVCTRGRVERCQCCEDELVERSTVRDVVASSEKGKKRDTHESHNNCGE